MFRDLIRARLTQLELTQADLSRASGVGQVSLTRYLSGQEDIKGATLEKILQTLGGVKFGWGRRPKIERHKRTVIMPKPLPNPKPLKLVQNGVDVET